MRTFYWLLIFIPVWAQAQTARAPQPGEIAQQLQKLKVLSSVLYMAAHPDDENTRLLAWMANEKKVRAGYLSITRGDGGQNLIGTEQGIDLGLIRTQELLAARRVDGAEQFFTSAYDFGYSKSPEEALRIWNHEKILGEVVWVIRQFQPDLIIARFPTTGEGGHGHHTASAILAAEAFDAAADPNRFPEHFQRGVKPWKAQRLFWNTFNFGSTNTTRDDQLKLDVGQYNPLLGKGYGELAAESRSQHKSQGFGVPAQRGSITEYFSLLKGSPVQQDLWEGISTGWDRIQAADIHIQVDTLLQQFRADQPQKLVPGLIALLKKVRSLPDSYWKSKKETEITALIENCLGLYVEMTADRQLLSVGDSVKLNGLAIRRLPGELTETVMSIWGHTWKASNLQTNQLQKEQLAIRIPDTVSISQPYWLERGLKNGSFILDDESMAGMAQNENLQATIQIQCGDISWKRMLPVRYKFTDPVKGELYQPVTLVPPVLVQASPALILFRNQDKEMTKKIQFSIQAKQPVTTAVSATVYGLGDDKMMSVTETGIRKMEKKLLEFPVQAKDVKTDSKQMMGARVMLPGGQQPLMMALHKIQYDHIPDVYYHAADQVALLRIDLNIAGKQIGYIAGAGDRVPEALEQMGYTVTVLTEEMISMPSLTRFDAIVTGVRAYNVHEWLSARYDALMAYVEQGGVLLVQYNTNSSIGPVKARISPYPFQIGRTRITDEQATVQFLKPGHRLLTYPNTITEADFAGWVQERSVYHAEQFDPAFETLLSFQDPGEGLQAGSLIAAQYGKGRFIYTGLSLFRQLPAAVPGAFRLLANLLAAPATK